jgi:chorismate synthase
MELLGGPLFAVAGAGESHGPAVTTIVFGCPPGLWLAREQVQVFLDRRRPGSSKHGTPRQEKDRLLFLSGLYQDDHDALTAGPDLTMNEGDLSISTTTYQEGYTTGEPISAIVLSAASKSAHYDQFRGPEGEVRPGHTDLVKYHQSRGFVDIRGGGRSSYRSTISDVIGGSIGRLFLQQTFGTRIFSTITQVGSLRTEQTLAAAANPFGPSLPAEEISRLEAALSDSMDAYGLWTLDPDFARAAGDLIRRTRIEGDSLGAEVEVAAVNVPPLVGDPLYNSLKVKLMGVLGGLHAAQYCEMGDGRAVVGRRGSENNDPIRQGGYQRNSHGGLIGGITTGNPLVARVGFKPTSSIVRPQQSVRKNLEEIEFELRKGRHDPCVGVRAGITLESRMAIEVMNSVLMHQSREIDPERFRLFSPSQ